MIARINDWNELRRYLEGAFAPVKELGDRHLEVMVSVGDASRAITLKPWQALGVEMLELRSSLGPAREVPPTGALLRNNNRIIGPFGVSQGSLVVRQLLPFPGLTAAQLDEAVRAVAQNFSPT